MASPAVRELVKNVGRGRVECSALDGVELELVRRYVHQERDVRAEIASLRERDRDLTQQTIAREAGIGVAVLNRWLKDSYDGDLRSLEAKLARWIDAYYVRELQRRMLPSGPEWVPTPTAQRVVSALRYAQAAIDIAVIYGAAGLGKTTAAKHHAQESPNVWIATMSPATSSVVPALEEIVDAVGLREIGGGGAKLQRAIISRVIGTHGLLIIDEAQHLSVAALDAIRTLHDAAHVGLALLGNETVYARMTGGMRAAYLDRLHSRIGKRVRLIHATEADVDAVTRAWNVRDPAGRQALGEIARRPGGLRAVAKVLRLASITATEHDSESGITLADIRNAWAELGGDGA